MAFRGESSVLSLSMKFPGFTSLWMIPLSWHCMSVRITQRMNLATCGTKPASQSHGSGLPGTRLRPRRSAPVLDTDPRGCPLASSQPPSPLPCPPPPSSPLPSPFSSHPSQGGLEAGWRQGRRCDGCSDDRACVRPHGSRRAERMGGRRR